MFCGFIRLVKEVILLSFILVYLLLNYKYLYVMIFDFVSIILNFLGVFLVYLFEFLSFLLFVFEILVEYLFFDLFIEVILKLIEVWFDVLIGFFLVMVVSCLLEVV